MKFLILPMATVACPRHRFCKLCWGIGFGVQPPHCRYQFCPAMMELGANLLMKTNGQFTSLLPTKSTSIPQAPPGPTQADSPLGKRARRANSLSETEIQAFVAKQHKRAGARRRQFHRNRNVNQSTSTRDRRQLSKPSARGFSTPSLCPSHGFLALSPLGNLMLLH